MTAWLIWLLLGVWWSLISTLRMHGREVALLEGVSVPRLIIILMVLALRWCIPPRQVLEFGLYRHPERAFEYIYDMEIASFHKLLSQYRDSDYGNHVKLLQDKLQLGKELTAHGIPMVQTLGVFSRGSEGIENLLVMLSEEQRLFCKSRHGCKGLGSFAVWHCGNDASGRMLYGRELPDSSCIQKTLNKLLVCDDVLVQPYLANHELLCPLSREGLTITLRVVTFRQSGNTRALCAFVAIPIFVAPSLRRITHMTLPIELDTGQLLPYPDHGFLNQSGRILADELFYRWPRRCSLPFWRNVLKHSIRAHEVLSGLWGVAWDWVLTPDGPVMLEGNSGWGLMMPQLICGGFLAFENNMNPMTAVNLADRSGI